MTAADAKPQPSDAAAKSDHDSPWKEALERFFPEFLALLFPAIHVEIDWSKGVQFLDKEFQQIVREAKTTRRYADKLVGVTLCDGTAVWVLIHVEVQGEPETAFAERMYTYHYKIRDTYQVPVASLAVLADADRGFSLIRLPEALEADFRQQLYAFEEQQCMPYVTTVEQAGIQKGLQQGEARTLLRQLTQKFGPEAAQAYRERIEAAELEQLEAWLDRILSAETPETIFH